MKRQQEAVFSPTDIERQAPAVFALLVLAQSWPEVFPAGVVAPAQFEAYLVGRIVRGSGRGVGDRNRFANVYVAVKRAKNWIAKRFGATVVSAKIGSLRGYRLSERPDEAITRWLREEGYLSLPPETWNRFETQSLQNRVSAIDLFWLAVRATTARHVTAREHDRALNYLNALSNWFEDSDKGEGWLSTGPAGFFAFWMFDPPIPGLGRLAHLPAALRSHVQLERAYVQMDLLTPTSLSAAAAELDATQLSPAQMLTTEGSLLHLRILIARAACSLRFNIVTRGEYVLAEDEQARLGRLLEQARASAMTSGPFEQGALVHIACLLMLGRSVSATNASLLQKVQEDLRRAAQLYGLAGAFRDASVALVDWVWAFEQLHLRAQEPSWAGGAAVCGAYQAVLEYCEHVGDDRFGVRLHTHLELADAFTTSLRGKSAERVLGKRVMSEEFRAAKLLAAPWELPIVERLEVEIRALDRQSKHAARTLREAELQ